MKKITTLLMVVFATISFNLFAETEVVKTWDFTVWSEATVENLYNDATNWTKDPADAADISAVKRFRNAVVLSNSAYLKASGVEINELKGILFPALSATNLNLRHNYGNDGIQLGSSNQEVTITDLKAGQFLAITFVTAAGDGTARGIDAITNMTGPTGSANAYAGADPETYTYTVIANGNVKFKYGGGIILKKMELSQEVIPQDVPAISKKSGENEQTVTVNNAISAIVYEWAGSATSASVVWTDTEPTGITATPSSDDQTITIEGIPTVIGEYPFSVTATDGNTTTDPLTGKIIVNEASAFVVVDLGRDFTGNGTTGSASNALSGVLLNGASATIFPGTENEVSVASVGSNNYLSASDGTYGPNGAKNKYNALRITDGYIEVSLTDNSSTKEISALKINGTSGNTSTGATNIPILFSDKYPFDGNSIIGYDNTSNLPKCRYGESGVIISVIPAGCKSYRVYSKVTIIETEVAGIYALDATSSEGSITLSTGGNSDLRIPYISATLVEGAPITTPSLSKASGENEQSVFTNQAISDIVYRWGGTATSASIAWTGTANATTPPAGVEVNQDETAKTLTITGIPTTAGNYGFSVTATDGTNTTDPETGSIEVKAVVKPLLAYVTTLNDVRDDAFTTAFSDIFEVVKISSTATNVDYSSYEVVVLSAVPDSKAAGVLELNTKGVVFNKPFVNMKAYQLFQSTRWNWVTTATVANTTVQNIAVAEDAIDHPLFKGITLSGENSNEIVLSTGTANAAVKMTSMTDFDTNFSQAPITLATVTDANGTYSSYIEIPVGTTIGTFGTTAEKLVVLGLSEASYTTATDEAVAIAMNAVKYVTGIGMPKDMKITSFRVKDARTTAIDHENKTIAVKASQLTALTPTYLNTDSTLVSENTIITPALNQAMDFSAPVKFSVEGITTNFGTEVATKYTVVAEEADMVLTSFPYTSNFTDNFTSEILTGEQLPLWMTIPNGLSNPGGTFQDKEQPNPAASTDDDFKGGYMKTQRLVLNLESCGVLTFKWASNGGRLPEVKDQNGTEYLNVAANRGSKKMYTETATVNSQTPVTLTISFYNGTKTEDKLITAGIFHINVTKGPGTGIEDIKSDKAIVSKEYFDITGKKVYEGAKGFVIVKTTYEDGSSDSEKLFNK